MKPQPSLIVDTTRRNLQFTSRPRSYFRLTVAIMVCIVSLYYGVAKSSAPIFILAGVAGFVALLDLTLYQKTEIELNENQFTARVSKLFGLIKDEVIIPLEEIQTRCFEKESHSAWGFARISILELLFPSYPSQLTVHSTSGRTEVIPLDLSEEQARELLAAMPEQLPNG